MRTQPTILCLLAALACTGSGASDVEEALSPPGPIPTTEPTENEGPTFTEPGTTDTTDTTETTEEPPVSGVREACYLGLDRSHTTCIELLELGTVPAEYVYPAPLDGSPQYLEPAAYLELALLDPAMNLAPNFVLDEVAQEWKGPYAVVQPHAIEHLQQMRDQLGALVVNSGYRNPDYNAAVGGATWSRHMYGDAFDLDPVSVTLDDLADACYAEGADFVSVYVSHVHCDWRNSGLDAAFYGSSPMLAGLLDLGPLQTAQMVEVGGVFSAPAEGWDEGEPLRRWRAYDAAGNWIDSVEEATYVPPADAARVVVNVGLVLEIEADL